MPISFKVTPEERDTIDAIVDRIGSGDSVRMDWIMDITAAHANGCPLDLAGLLVAEEFDFAHDLYGIRRHINRTTGALEDCFLPRYAKAG